MIIKDQILKKKKKKKKKIQSFINGKERGKEKDNNIFESIQPIDEAWTAQKSKRAYVKNN